MNTTADTAERYPCEKCHAPTKDGIYRNEALLAAHAEIERLRQQWEHFQELVQKHADEQDAEIAAASQALIVQEAVHREEAERLRKLVFTYGEMPFPCHDFMTADEWEQICAIVALQSPHGKPC